jgi:hypothetical protein
VDFHSEHQRPHEQSPQPRAKVVEAQDAVDAEAADTADTATPIEGEPGLLATELRHHLPWTVAGVLIALTVVWTGVALWPATFPVNELFHFAHPVHLLLSAAATTAMASIHRAGWLRSTIIGIFGSAGVCTLSDIVLPYAGGVLIAGADHMHLHLCITEHPMLVVPFVVVGLAVGLLGPKAMERVTIYSHAGHVIASALASLLFLLAAGASLSVGTLGPVLLLLLVAVMVPCCVSDIVVPVLFGGPRCRHHQH